MKHITLEAATKLFESAGLKSKSHGGPVIAVPPHDRDICILAEALIESVGEYRESVKVPRKTAGVK